MLPEAILDEVEEIRAWIEHRYTLLHDWRLEKKIKPGFRSLFYGPPGTGKTLTAALLGKSTGSMCIGSTCRWSCRSGSARPRRTSRASSTRPSTSDWILFFDEADALFGKRTQTCQRPRSLRQPGSRYLLQRIEDFPGVVILASNLKGNIDDAFARRFQSMIYFPMPRPRGAAAAVEWRLSPIARGWSPTSIWCGSPSSSKSAAARSSTCSAPHR